MHALVAVAGPGFAMLPCSVRCQAPRASTLRLLLAAEIVEVWARTHAAPVMTATAPRWMTALLVGFSGSTMVVVLNMAAGRPGGML